MDIGVDVKIPEKSCEDKNCPFHGTLKVRGQILEGKVVIDKMPLTVVVERSYHRYIRKYERYEKKKSKVFAHNPECIGANKGNMVKIMECRPLSKGKNFVVIEKEDA